MRAREAHDDEIHPAPPRIPASTPSRAGARRRAGAGGGPGRRRGGAGAARQLDAQGGHDKEACAAYQHASDLANGQSAPALLGLSGCFTQRKEGAKAVAAARQALTVAATPEERTNATTALGFDLLRQPDEAAWSEALALFKEQAAGPAGPAKADGQRGVLVALLFLHRDQEAAELLASLRAAMSAADLQDQILNGFSYPGPADDLEHRIDFSKRAYRLSPDVSLSSGGKVTRPEYRTQTRPVLPDEARSHHGYSGSVILEGIIDTEGKIGKLKVLQGQPLGLTESAMNAVKTWTFKPSTLDGKPVKVWYVLTINFKIP